jgi:hypothetical protein
MKPKIILEKEGRVWRWTVKRGRAVVAGGYCRTKKDALNDATISSGGGGAELLRNLPSAPAKKNSVLNKPGAEK